MITAWDDEYLSPSVVNLTFPYYRYRPRDTNRTVCAIKKVGVLSILFVVGLLAVMAEAQQPKKVPRIGIYRSSMQLVSLPVPREYG